MAVVLLMLGVFFRRFYDTTLVVFQIPIPGAKRVT